VVPASPIAANHLDTGKPADVIAAAGYTAATKSCSTSCHGVGLPASNPARTNPTWNATILTGGVSTLGDGVSGGTNPGSGDCSKCHGYPPQNNHAVTNCSTCHTHMSSNSAFSNPSLHINGNVDFVSGCDGCHDYDTVGAAFAAGVWSGGSWGKNPQDGLTPNEGFGAHAKHINHIKTRLGYTAGLNTSAVFGAAGSDPARVCGTCHTNTVGNHTTAGGVPAGRSINFGDSAFVMGSTGGTSLLFGTTFPTQNPVYNGVPGTSKQTTAKTCSNISCHYFTTPNW
jgi:predicted CxxxxCH...CXXCH cytochrome family protein